MDVKELADEYALKADEELLLLAAASKDLTDEAQTVLAGEFARRGIEPPKPVQPVAPHPLVAPIRIVLPSVQVPARREASWPWQILWFFVHLVIVYFVMAFFPWRIALVAYSVRSALERHATTSLFDFFVAHLFLFSMLPGFVAGMTFARFNVKAARYVFLVPATILAVRILIYVGEGSVMFGAQPSHWWSGFRYYLVTDLADALRGIAQIRSAAPFYAAAAYTSGAIIAAESRLHDAIDRALGRGQGAAL